MKNFIYVSFVLFFSLTSILPCISSASNLSDIPLEWKPTDKVSDLGPIDAGTFKNVKFTILPFNDLRGRQKEIGEKRYANSDMKLEVTTSDDVAAWLTQHVKKLLNEFGVEMGGNNSDISIEADIVRFYVVEKSIYGANVDIRWHLKSAAGDELWEGQTFGTAHRWGRSFNSDNYFEALGNATLDAVNNFLKSDSLMRAVRNISSKKPVQNAPEVSDINEQMKSLEQEIQKSPNSVEQPIDKKLEKLKDWYERKLITKEEYDAERKKALDKF